MTIEEHPFCEFAQELNNSVHAQEPLNYIRQQSGLNQNIVLFCCWFAKTGQKRLNKKELNNLVTTSITWHEKVITPLKDLFDFAPVKFASEIKKTLIFAHKQEQLFLTDAVIRPRYYRSIEQQLTDAYKNIEAYLNLMNIVTNQQDIDTIQDLLRLVFKNGIRY